MRFFLVDRVDEFRLGEFARGVKNISLSEDILQDHFPENPIFPGTLTVEALAQLGGFLVELSCNPPEGPMRRAVLGQIDKAKFYQPARPGDQLELRCTLVSRVGDAAQVNGEALVEGQRVAQARLLFVLRTVDTDAVHRQRQALYRTWTRGLAQEVPIR